MTVKVRRGGGAKRSERNELMKFMALLVGAGMLVWALDLSTDLLLGRHEPWFSVLGIALGGVGWLVAAHRWSRGAEPDAWSGDSALNDESRRDGEAPTAVHDLTHPAPAATHD